PSEYLKLVNASNSGCDIYVDYVEVTAPFYQQWPPASHQQIFVASSNTADEPVYARAVLANFMARAWRRRASAGEVEQKVGLFERLRPQCDSFEQAMVEVLAAVLSSPHFLYLVAVQPKPHAGDTEVAAAVSGLELATRLSMFLWCSVPDDELLACAHDGRLQRPDVLLAQVQRMLASSKSRRFSEHFVRQWLGLQLLDFLHVDPKRYPQFDAALQAAMRAEPVAFFHEVLDADLSALEFLHCNFAMVDER